MAVETGSTKEEKVLGNEQDSLQGTHEIIALLREYFERYPQEGCCKGEEKPLPPNILDEVIDTQVALRVNLSFIRNLIQNAIIKKIV